jgi:hypothetical protein
MITTNQKKETTIPGILRPPISAMRSGYPASADLFRHGGADLFRHNATVKRYWFPVLNAASKDAAGGSKSNRRRKVSASGAPARRSMPASSHSTETGPW